MTKQPTPDRNDALIGLLKAGDIGAFNQQHRLARQRDPDFYLNLHRIDLSGRDLSHADLRNASFLGGSLKGARLKSADLTNSTLSHVDCSHADLTSATLYYARANSTDFSHATLDRANLEGLYASEANFTHATLTHTNLKRACLLAADFTDADLTGAKLQESLCAFATMRNTTLSRSNFSKSDLRGTDFTPSHLDRTLLRDALFSTDEQFTVLKEKGAVLSDDPRIDPLERDSLHYYSKEHWNQLTEHLAHVLLEDHVLGHQALRFQDKLLFENAILRPVNPVNHATRTGRTGIHITFADTPQGRHEADAVENKLATLLEKAGLDPVRTYDGLRTTALGITLTSEAAEAIISEHAHPRTHPPKHYPWMRTRRDPLPPAHGEGRS